MLLICLLFAFFWLRTDIEWWKQFNVSISPLSPRYTQPISNNKNKQTNSKQANAQKPTFNRSIFTATWSFRQRLKDSVRVESEPPNIRFLDNLLYALSLPLSDSSPHTVWIEFILYVLEPEGSQILRSATFVSKIPYVTLLKVQFHHMHGFSLHHIQK